MSRTLIVATAPNRMFWWSLEGDPTCCGVYHMCSWQVDLRVDDYNIHPEKYDISQCIEAVNKAPINPGMLVRATCAQYVPEKRATTPCARSSRNLLAKDVLLACGFTETRAFINPNTGNLISCLEKVW